MCTTPFVESAASRQSEGERLTCRALNFAGDVWPNITGRFNRDGRKNGPTYGIITKENLSTGPFYASDDVGRGCAGSEAVMAGDLMFDASRSSSFFGLSTTVQPPAIRLLPCIKL